MAHPEQQQFVENLKTDRPEFFKNKKVLEVGSLDINGSIRSLFEKCDYLGIDVGEGKGVDVVCQGQDLDHPDGTYDVASSTECFEHNPYWAETFANMTRMTKPGGLVFFTCATHGRHTHGTRKSHRECSPLTVHLGENECKEYDNYYRNLAEEDFESEFDLTEMFSYYEFSVNKTSCDLYFWGIKR